MVFRKQLHLFVLLWSWHSASFAQDVKVAIASAHPLATQAGLEIIKQGGNVYDAAVAVSAALAVVEPAGSGLGGGGYWLLRGATPTPHSQGAFETMIDGRETAPLFAHATMYLDNMGNSTPQLSLNGALAAAIPGLPAALVHLSTHYGLLPLAQSLAPAIRYAKYGFAISDRYLRNLQQRAEVISRFPASAHIFLNSQNALPERFSILKQTDLADTLSRLAASGHDGFYKGKTAGLLLKSVAANGGVWTQQDLESYHIIERQPIHGNYQGITITSAAPSSSGGVVLLETLNILAGYDLTKVSSVTRKHLIIEAMRRAYHDRALYLGDPAFNAVPVSRLLSADYAAGLRASINSNAALPSRLLSGENDVQTQGNNTSHFSIIDDQGNAVAATLSINQAFGSGLVAQGTGVLLNDEMDDFSSQPGVMNGYGLVGGQANAIAPGKRPLSSMTPTFLETPGQLAALGTPGGSRIISMVLLAVLDFTEGHNPDAWVKVPRFHHQFMPDVIEYEKAALTAEEISQLSAMGHQLNESPVLYGNMQAVLWQKSTTDLFAASDPRGEGYAVVTP